MKIDLVVLFDKTLVIKEGASGKESHATMISVE